MAARPLEAAFGRIVGLRVPILVLYALLVPAAAWLATRIPSEGAIGSLVVPSDPDYAATRAFQRLFPEGQIVMLLLEADDPWSPEALAAADAVAGAVRGVPGVTVYSALDVYRRARPGFAPDAPSAAAFRAFATGAELFRRQGLVGDRFLGLAVAFPSRGSAARDATLAAVDAAIERAPHGPVKVVRKVGAPYVEAWIEHESGQASLRWFPVFGLLVVGLALFLYRSVRSLLAILLALGAAVALAVGAGRLLGFSFTVVSALVPLTVMVTALASLVYLHSRFVDQPEGVEVDEHQRHALANKFLPVTASSVAAVLGFAALAVSPIRPIREMGVWTAAGLALSWVVAFTLFPALQKVLRTPTGRTVPIRSALYDRVAGALPAFTWRLRVPLVAAALLLSAAGVVALTGLPGRLAPMRVGVDSLDYVDPDLAIHRDMVFFREHVSGLNVARAWVRTAPGVVTDPEVLRGLDRFASAAEALPGVTSVVGPTTFLRMRQYLAGGGDRLPQDPDAFARATADVEQLLLTQPELRAFVDVGGLSDAQLTVVFDRGDEAGYQALAAALRQAWDRTVAGDPAFRGAELRLVGESLLQAKVGAGLVPTLTESFALTAALIFLAFLAVFRSASARLMAMIPSVFAILVTFLGLRLAGGALNVATILIATTVLGTTENDQIHFFHHLHEGEGRGLEAALRHSLRVSGRAIVFATLINAAGFLGLAFSRFPPLRQFGVVTSAAFLLAMLADFTALPGALGLVRRERPAEGAAAAGAAQERGGRAT
ncbi:MAG TPA: MMPL family transporter, partial [Anaeromyxobacteraceae bacterium]|nr:MMPL family transporter [Anaeromyxobacteraceae bacterium]